MVTALNKYGAPIDGIGTKMHITLGQNLANIDYLFKKLASTGLKVRISENACFFYAQIIKLSILTKSLFANTNFYWIKEAF